MMRVLAWKECREQRTVWVAMLALAFLVVLAMPAALATPGMGQLGATELQMVIAVALLTAGVQGLVCGAMMLAGEREGGTLPFLDALAGRRTGVWWAKFLCGLAFTLVLGGTAGVVAMAFGPSSESAWPASRWLITFPAVAVDAFVWGMLGSAFCRSTMAAIAIGAACLGVTWTFTGFIVFDPGAPGVGIAARLALGIVALAFSAWGFCRSDLSRGPVQSTARPVLGMLRIRGSARALLWLIVRQSAGEVIVLGLLALLTGFFVPKDLFGVWAVGSLILGVLAGSGVFSGEQRGGYQPFLADQRLPMGRVWCFKVTASVVFLFMYCCFLAMASAVMAGYMAWYQRESFLEQSNMRDTIALFLDICGFGMLASLWPVIGFSVGQFFSLAFRKGVVAVVLGMMAAGTLAVLWLPSLLAGGLAWWQLLGVPVILLAGTRLTAWAWASDRLQTTLPALILTACAVFALLWSGGVFAYRALEIPDGGEPFDVAAYEAGLEKRPQTEAWFLLSQACQRMREAVVQADKEIGVPRDDVTAPKPGEVAVVGAPKAEPGLWYMPYVRLIALGQDYPAGNEQLNHWMDRLFVDKWAERLQASLQEPPWFFVDPRYSSYFMLPAFSERFADLHTIQTLLAARAYQLLAYRNPLGSLDKITELLALSRLEAHNPGILRFAGNGTEAVALAILERWLTEVGEQPALVRKALAALQAHERARPGAAETEHAGYLIARARLNNPIEALADSLGRQRMDEQRAEVKSRLFLLGLALQTPWERERMRRMLNLVYTGRMEALRKSYPAVIGAVHQRRGNFTRGSGMLFDWFPPEKLALRADTIANVANHSWYYVFGFGEILRMIQNEAASTCKLAAVKLQLALVLHELDQGRAASTLDELVPRYLSDLPVDPFSGGGFHYRVSRGEKIIWHLVPKSGEESEVMVPAGEGILWSTGPDRVDNGGVVRGNETSSSTSVWFGRPSDWIFRVPRAKRGP
jgi:hypothetical protein